MKSKNTMKSKTKKGRTWRDVIRASEKERLEFVISDIENLHNDLQPGIGAVMIFDTLSDESRNEILRRLKFTGMVASDEFYGEGGSLATFKLMEKDWMFGQIDQYCYDNDPDPDYGFFIGYDSGEVICTSDFSGRVKVPRRGAVWAVGTGLMSGYYWCRKGKQDQMKEYNGFTQWRKGKPID